MQLPEAAQWRAACEKEHNALQRMGVYCLVPLPLGRATISSRWVFKIKLDKDNKPIKFKARIVARASSRSTARTISRRSRLWPR